MFQFEVRNRDFFEKSIPSRGDAYYQYDHFLRGLQALLDEQAALKLFLEGHAPHLNVRMICAKTTPDNISSQKVLMKNGFEHDNMESETPDDFLH